MNRPTRCIGPRRLLPILAGLFFTVAGLTAAQDTPSSIELEVSDRSRLEQLSRLVSIDTVQGTLVRASASPRQLDALRAAGFDWDEVEMTATTVTMCPEGWAVDAEPTWNCYPTYGQYVAFMESLAEAHPDLCRLSSIGRSANLVRRHDLLVLEISDNPGIEEDEPGVFLTSSMHGDETTGYVLMLRLAYELLTEHGVDVQITALVDETEIWINPLANPDGTFFSGDYTVAGATRQYTTASGGPTSVNPNRNFPDPDDGMHPDGNPWWPETQAMMAFAAEHTIALAANLHGGAEVVNYPWDTWSRLHADDQWFVELSRSYADLAQSDSPGGYMTDLDDGITNGWDWYPVSGGRQDFTTYFHGWREVTIEVSHTKLLPAADLDSHWQYNHRALLDFISNCHVGIRGRVLDADGRPLAATVEVLGHDRAEDRSAVSTDPEIGDFHRLLLPGTYDLSITAPGYVSETVGGIPVVDGEATVVDVVLHTAPPRRSLGRVR